MADTIYLEGVRVFKPHENAPEFVKGAGVIAINALVQFCKENPSYMSDYKGEAQIKFQILEGRNGLYFAVDTWRPNETNSTEDAEATGNSDKPAVEDNDDLPF